MFDNDFFQRDVILFHNVLQSARRVINVLIGHAVRDACFQILLINLDVFHGEYHLFATFEQAFFTLNGREPAMRVIMETQPVQNIAGSVRHGRLTYHIQARFHHVPLEGFVGAHLKSR